MNKVFGLLITLAICSCGTQKSMKTSETEGTNKVESKDMVSKRAYDELRKLYETEKSDLSSKNELLSNAESKIASLEEMNQECSENLQSIIDTRAIYKAKLDKMKAELQSAFPNNLDNENFSIREDNGRLLITIPNNILYKSGNADFDENGLMVIQKLSKVFRANEGLQILVEGHTDDLPLKKNNKYNDNWDLSLARSVNVVRQLETYGVFPSRLTAAGRGYFAPLSRLATDEARAQNRRTEIIIRPQIAELLKMIDEIE